MLSVYNLIIVLIRNTSLGAQHSMGEVACSHPNPPGGNFLGESSGLPCKVPPRLVLICLVLGSLLQESLSEG